jgi:hypothetical protein
MIAEIMATGEEIRSGASIDSNSAYIAAKLEENGVAVNRHICVGRRLAAVQTLQWSPAGWGRHPMILPQRPLPGRSEQHLI